MLSKHINSFPVSKSPNWDTHPIVVVDNILNRYGDSVEFEFSRYSYSPQTIKDEREIFNVSGKDISVSYIADLIQNLGSNTELAFHSRIKIGSEIKHIPMIDLSAVSAARAHKGLFNVLPERFLTDLILFDSGRSFHVYSLSLIEENYFGEFLGRLLLSNKPGEPLLVDARWVGHRLIAGYMSLRWSCNSESYLQYPKLAANSTKK